MFVVGEILPIKNGSRSSRFLLAAKQELIQLRACSNDGIRDIVLFEVFYKLGSQVACRLVVLLSVGPGVAWVQQVAVNAFQSLRNQQVEHRDSLGFNAAQFAILDCRDHSTGSRDAEALTAGTVSAAGPAGVNQINLRVEFGN